MSANYRDLLKYAATGQASPSMTYYDKLRASTLMGGAVQTLTGIPPLSFKSNGKPLVSWSMLGNGQQTGTPTHSAPIQPEFVGVRTGQLIPYPYYQSDGTVSGITWTTYSDGRVVGTGKTSAGTNFSMAMDLALPNGTYTIAVYGAHNGMTLYLRDTTGSEFLVNISPSSSDVSQTFTVNQPGTHRLYFNTGYTDRDVDIDCYVMLNSGSTTLPYEPYGWKAPFENHGENLLSLNRTYSTSFTTDTTKWMNGAATLNNAGTGYAETEILGDVIKVTSKNPGYGASFLIEASPNTTYTVSFETDKVSSGSWGGISDRDINGTVISNSAIQGKSATFTTNANCAFLNVCFRFPPADGTVTFSNIMLNLGSEAKPYSPYINETRPIYLGQTQTVRRIKKLVLTGEEIGINKRTSPENSYSISFDRNSWPVSKTGYGISSHFVRNGTVANLVNGEFYVGTTAFSFRLDNCTDVAAFRQYLAAQYAAGTPVTVWYVLAEPQTAIVNEPLAKIGDYADELHSKDAGVTIPTVKGSNTLTVDTPIQPSEMTIKYRE